MDNFNDENEVIIEPEEIEEVAVQKVDTTEIATSDVINEEGILPFERMDFNNPITIMHYTSDIITAQKDKIEELERLVKTEKVNNVRLNNNIKNLATFADPKEQKMLEAPKAVKETGIFKLFKKARNKVVEAREELLAKTEKDVTEMYFQQIDEIASDMEKQKNNTLISIDLNNRIIESVIPFVRTLEYAYKIGLVQRDEYEQNVIKELEEQSKTNPSDMVSKQLTNAKTLLMLVDRALERVQKSFLFGKSRIEQAKIRTNNDMISVINYEEMINNGLVQTKIEARDAVQNAFQKIRIEQQGMLADAINEVAVKNSETAKKNAEKVIDILSKGTLYTETFEKITDNIRSAREALDNAEKTVQERILEDRKTLDAINEEYDAYDESINNIIDVQKFVDSHPITHDHKVVKKFTPRRKKEDE